MAQKSSRTTRHRIPGVVLGCAALLGTPLAEAKQPGWDPQASHLPDTADHVRVVAVERGGGRVDEAKVTVVIDPGFHINANPASDDYLIPTTLKITNVIPSRVIYPEPVPFKPNFADEVLSVYEGTIAITADFSSGALSSERRLFGTLTAQACTENVCLPPADLPLPK